MKNSSWTASGIRSAAMVRKRTAEAVSEAATDMIVLAEGAVSGEYHISSSFFFLVAIKVSWL